MLSRAYNLDTDGGLYPVAILGEAKVQSSHPAFETDLDTDYLLYVTLHDSPAYGNPAFWFGETRQLEINFIETDVAEREIDERTLLEAVLRRVLVFGRELVVDNTGLSTYHLLTPEKVDNKFIIVPDGYS